MGIPGLEQISVYATPPNNYIGTAIFLYYIILALYATISITHSLYTRYNTIFSSPNAAKIPISVQTARNARGSHIKVYAFLASISFATLSYHMLLFLIKHYIAWNSHRDFSTANVSIESLKIWMLNSTLFQDFAQQLVQDAPSAIWTQCAILATWFWNIWIAQKVHQHNLPPTSLKPFILLTQILPISFTSALFLIHLHLSSQDIQPPSSLPLNQRPLPKQPPYPKPSLQIPSILLNATLLSLPPLRTNEIFIPLVLIQRALLLLPLLDLVSLKDEDIVKSISVSGAFAFTNCVVMKRGLGIGGVLGVLGSGGFAVRAMGWDKYELIDSIRRWNNSSRISCYYSCLAVTMP